MKWVLGIVAVVACAPAMQYPSGVSMTPEVMNKIGFLYTFINEVEFAVCLDGAVVGDTLFITGVELADILQASRTSVTASCGAHHVAKGHSHPSNADGFEHCILSQADMQNLASNEPFHFSFVFCSPEPGVVVAVMMNKSEARENLARLAAIAIQPDGTTVSSPP